VPRQGRETGAPFIESSPGRSDGTGPRHRGSGARPPAWPAESGAPARQRLRRGLFWPCRNRDRRVCLPGRASGQRRCCRPHRRPPPGCSPTGNGGSGPGRTLGPAPGEGWPRACPGPPARHRWNAGTPGRPVVPPSGSRRAAGPPGARGRGAGLDRLAMGRVSSRKRRETKIVGPVQPHPNGRSAPRDGRQEPR